MKKQVQIQYVIEKLSYFCQYVKINNRNSFTDINLLAEGFLMNLVNIVLGLDLCNLNEQQINYPGVDLGDLFAKIAFQVTSKKDSKKIIETYETVLKDYKGIGKVTDVFSEHIYFLIIDEKKTIFQKKTLEQITRASQGRFHETDILDINDIIKKVVSLYDKDYERFMQVYYLISRTIDTLPFIPTDKIVVEEILTCFNRPAFTVAFRDECNLGDFDAAIMNTISLINTGKSVDGILLKYNVNDVNDKVIKGRLAEIVTGLNYLRKIFTEMKKRGYATECECGDPKCKMIFNNDFEFCWLMNDLRIVILFFADKLAQSVGCDFNVFPEYMEIKKCGETSEKLRVCMDEVYAYHNAKLSR